MTESHPHPDAAPEAAGDVIAGDPPVPITVWQAPAARPGETLSFGLAVRLVANLTHRRTLVLDLTRGRQLAQAAGSARRRHRRVHLDGMHGDDRPAALIVTGWPEPDTDEATLMAACSARLTAGGCVAVVLGAVAWTVNQRIIAAARSAGLSYLQHVVAAHDLTGRGSPSARQVAVHSDVLLFTRPRGFGGG